MGEEWYRNSFRRNLVDMHIEDWDASFLSQFDANNYVAMLKKAHVQSAMLYANSHVGYCYWPTPVGRMHAGIKGRDILGELVGLCRQEGMDVILYYTLVYDNWAYDHHPSWRILDCEGKASRERRERTLSSGRYGVCCPNSSGYREYVRGQLADLAKRYDFQGMFLDMTFWPLVCYCDSCRQRFAREVGGEMPATIDWDNARWVEFQYKREEWLSEFAHFATAALKTAKPEATVDHQFSTSLHDWVRGSTDAIADASDYCGGDFYGGFHQQSFICKLFYNLTRGRPFEYHTSRCYPSLLDHTTMKTKEMLEMHACIALAHYGAFLFIDAIDPVGTLNPKVYETLGEVFSKTKQYDAFIGGEFCQDVAIYFSLTSKMDLADNGKPVAGESKDSPRLEAILNPSQGMPHLDAAVGAARNLKAAHIPFGVISKRNLSAAKSYRAVILPDVLFLDAEEKDALEAYVREGGSLYVSGSRACRLLPGLLGTTISGETDELLTYIAPTERGAELFPDIRREYPLTIFGRQPLVTADSSEEVMATVTLPYTDPFDTTRFASIHSDPPGKPTGYAAAISRAHGRGRVIWISHPIERANQPPHRRCFLHMIRTLVPGGFSFELDAPPAVEATAFHQAREKRFVLNFMNLQEELPPVPVTGMEARLKVSGKAIRRAVAIPEERDIPYRAHGDYVEVDVPVLDIYRMITVDYH
jgi:hypothetical protein